MPIPWFFSQTLIQVLLGRAFVDAIKLVDLKKEIILVNLSKAVSILQLVAEQVREIKSVRGIKDPGESLFLRWMKSTCKDLEWLPANSQQGEGNLTSTATRN